MIHEKIAEMVRVLRRGTRRRSAPKNRRRLLLESLEDRRMLANITVTDAFLRDGLGLRNNTPVLGERIELQVNFRTTDLFQGAAYRIEFSIDGVTLDSGLITSGAGSANGLFSQRMSGWYAESGEHTVDVVLDAGSNIAESNEQDNTFSFAFTPVRANLPSTFIWPETDTPFQDHLLGNYVDLDPTSGIRDWRGNTATFNGHQGLDLGGTNFAAMDAGRPVVAAADGVVVAIADGNPDRSTFFSALPANLVAIDHGDGWQTSYLHLRRDSVEVKVGDEVQQGDMLGLEGSSGNSTASHLHFGVQHHGRSVETFLDPNAYWANPLGYVGDEPFMVDSGHTNYNPIRHLKERPSDVDVTSQASFQTSYVWGRFSGLREDDFVEFTWVRPNGVVHARRSTVVPQDQSTSTITLSTNLPAVPDIGMWTIDIRNNRKLLGQQTFEVTAAGEPEIRIDDAFGEILLDERHSPVDFGSVAQKSIPPSNTFTVVNHGTDTLLLSGMAVPHGFLITEGLGAALAPGTQETFSIILNTSDAGYYGGQIRVFSSDTDEPIYNISIEGTVTTLALETITLGIGNRTISEAGMTIANVTRSGNPTLPLFVTLENNLPRQATIPSSVLIPAGQASVTFSIVGINDSLEDGVQVVEVTASAPNFADATNTLNVVDIPTLLVNIEKDEISEADGRGASQVTIARLGGDSTISIEIVLEVNDLTEASVPLLVTMEPFQTVAVISLDAVDDTILDGPRTVILTATADGFDTGTDTVQVLDHETLTIALDGTTIAEDGILVSGTITRSNTDNQDPLVVQLRSDDTSEATVVPEVTIPGGEATIAFSVRAVDDDLLDGDQLVILSATAPAFVDGRQELLVTDGEDLLITIEDFAIFEHDGVTTATVTRSNSNNGSPLRVILNSSDTSEATVPPFVDIPANQNSVEFQITAVDDDVLDGNRNVVITPFAAGYRSGLAPLVVIDHETLSISLARSSIFEDGGMTIGTVTRNNTNLGAALRVALSTNDAGEATVPSNVQIAPNQASATFIVMSVDDFVVDGEQTVVVTAFSAGYVPATESLIVSEVPGLSITNSTSSLSEDSAPATITVRRHNTDKSQILTVTLTTSPSNQAVVPASVDIPMGESSVAFDFDPIDDSLLDGSQPVIVTAAAAGLPDVSTTITVEDHETLTLNLTASSIDEDGPGTMATVIRGNTDIQAPLTVFIQTDDPSEATALSSVIIPANQASIEFLIAAVDDALLDGPQNVTFTVSAPRYQGATAVIEVRDKEQLTVSLASGTISENGGSVTGTVTRSNTDLGFPIIVQLFSDHPGEATTPVSVQILPQQSSATFTINAVDDNILDGTVSVVISAMSMGYEDGMASLNVSDHETLSVTLDETSISEQDGMTTGVVSRGNTDIGSPLTVQVGSSDTSEAAVAGTVVIPSNQTSAPFQVIAINDSIFDGDQDVTISATADGYFDGGTTLTVTDHEGLTLSLTATEISEQLGSTTATVTRSNTDLLFPIIVTVTTDDPNRTQVANTVIIRAGNSSSAPFRIFAIDNHILDGPSIVTFSVASPGYEGDTQTLTILDKETLTVTLQDSQISEHGGQTTAIVRRNNIDLDQPLLVNLAGNDPTEALVPSTVVIPAGEVQSLPVAIFAIDDSVFDGDQTVVLSATANGYEPTSATLIVTDLEILSVSIDATRISERNGTATGTVTRLNTDIGQSLLVGLVGNDATEATVPSTVMIPANSMSQTFTISARDDSILDGDQMFTVTVSSTGYADAIAEIDITDLETLTATLAQSEISEMAGRTTLTLARNNSDVGQPLAVTLTTDDPSEINFISNTVIPSNATSVTIDINALDDLLLDGTQTVKIIVTAVGYEGDTAMLDVTDHESLAVSIADVSISELDGTTVATITRSNLDDNSALVVTLTGQLQMPGDNPNANPPFALGTVEIASGEPSANFSVSAIDDDLLTGPRTLTISVSAAGFVSADAATILDDFETLTVTIDAFPLREGATTTATITRNNTNLAEDVVVSLTHNDPNRLNVPPEVIIPAGQASTTFDVTSLDDGQATGNLMLAVGATAEGYQPTSLEIEVEDVPFRWLNPVRRTDVNNDGLLTPADVLILVNELNLNGARVLPLTGDFAPPPYLDVNGDGTITPGDVGIVINEINAGVEFGAESEGSTRLIVAPIGRLDFQVTALQSPSLKQEMTPRRMEASVRRNSQSPVASHRHGAIQRNSLPLRRMTTPRDLETDELDSLLDLLAADVASRPEFDE